MEAAVFAKQNCYIKSSLNVLLFRNKLIKTAFSTSYHDHDKLMLVYVCSRYVRCKKRKEINLTKFGMIDQGQLQHALNSIYESGGVLDVSSVMPDAEIIDGADVADDSSSSGFDYSIFDKQSAEDANSTDDGSEDWGADDSSDDASANLSTSDDSVDDSVSEGVVTEEDTTGTQNS